MTVSDRGELPSRHPKKKSTYHIIKQFQIANKEKEYAVNHDELTGLYNQRFWLTEVNRLTNSRNRFTVAVVDLDGFKQVNDSEGHSAGNQTLVNTAEFLKSAFRGSDIIARTGGDEFAILLELSPEIDQEELLNTISHRLSAGQQALNFSYGISQCSSGEGLKQCIEESDQLMYDNKKQRKKVETSIEYT